MRLYLDANSIIYSVEGVPAFRLAALAWIERAEVAQGVVITSRLSRLEWRVKPLRESNADLLERFEGFFSREGLELVEVSCGDRTGDRASRQAQLPSTRCGPTCNRDPGQSRRLPDGDRNLGRCPGLTVEVLSGSPGVS